MISFASDYIAGAHPEVLKKLTETNLENLSGYGTDKYTLSAAEKIREACECPDADVYFLAGGTQTNQTVISTMLENFEGVIAADSGHISLHEAGAIEYTGHKVLMIPSTDGKITASAVEKYVKDFYEDENHEHMVFPGMVYISFPTEYGTLYSKSELADLSRVCRSCKITLYMDGARLGYGLASRECDLTLPEIAKLVDVFYIGGTKVGALCGEAVVFTKNNTPAHFVAQIKQHGALLAKGRVCGVQFDALFTDNLYMKISEYAIEMAERLKALFLKKNYRFFIDSPTNQQFIILDNQKMSELSRYVEFSYWEKYDDSSTVVRFATSWSTTEADLLELERLI